jgi:disulfide bond formation protein DsbB
MNGLTWFILMISGTISKAVIYHVLFISLISLLGISPRHTVVHEPDVQSVSACSDMNNKVRKLS